MAVWKILQICINQKFNRLISPLKKTQTKRNKKTKRANNFYNYTLLIDLYTHFLIFLITLIQKKRTLKAESLQGIRQLNKSVNGFVIFAYRQVILLTQ